METLETMETMETIIEQRKEEREMIKIVRLKDEETGEWLNCPHIFCDICGQKIIEDEGHSFAGEFMWFPDNDNPMGWKAGEVHFVHHRCALNNEKLRDACWHMMENFYQYLGVNLGLIKEGKKKRREGRGFST